MMNNTAVSGLDFNTTPTAGGSPFAITLTTSAAGNPNSYYIDWGDGTAEIHLTLLQVILTINQMVVSSRSL